jgi:hypothetical protein
LPKAISADVGSSRIASSNALVVSGFRKTRLIPRAAARRSTAGSVFAVIMTAGTVLCRIEPVQAGHLVVEDEAGDVWIVPEACGSRNRAQHLTLQGKEVDFKIPITFLCIGRPRGIGAGSKLS